MMPVVDWTAAGPLVWYQLVALAMLCLGVLGMVWRRTLVGMLISVELILNGAGLAIVSAAQLTPVDDALGQLAALLIMGLAAAEATLVLAILYVTVRRFGHARVDDLTLLRG